MQAVILTAGRGERMQPLSFAKQKHLIRILGKTIIEHNLDQLNGLVKEVILVIRPDERCRAIKKLIGSRYKGLKIKYAIQKEALGTADAAKAALSFLKDRFLLLNGDDLYFKEDIKKALKLFPSLLAKEVEQPQFFGIVGHKERVITSFVEKPQRPKSNLANTGLYFLPKKIFDYHILKSTRGEYEFTDYIRQFIKEHKLYAVKASQWIPISFCWNLLEANKVLLLKAKEMNYPAPRGGVSLRASSYGGFHPRSKERGIPAAIIKQGRIEKGCQVSGKLIIGKGTLIKSGTCIEGPVYIGKNCLIGPNCFLRKSLSIEDNCKIDRGSTIENSLIGRHTVIGHSCFISNSVIGEDCDIGIGTITISFDKSGKTIRTKVNGRIIDTKRVQLGTVLGDKVKTGAGTLILPGVKIWPRRTTLSGQKVRRDINHN